MKCIRMIWQLALVFALAGTATAQTHTSSITARLQKLMKDPLLRHSEVGITVYDLTDMKTLFAYQDKTNFRPASIEKIITSVSALDRLGTKYHFCTELYYTGTIVNGILHGDLYVKGVFDPEFNDQDMHTLVEAVQDAGIIGIDGKVLGDVSMKDSVYYGEGWSWDDAQHSFQPCLSPLMFNRGYVTVIATPGARGDKARVTVTPHSSYYTVDNQALTRVPRAGTLRIDRNWMGLSNTIRVRGNVMRTTLKRIPLFDSGSFFITTFADRLHQAGISTGVCGMGVTPKAVVRLGGVARPIREVLARAMKRSDNLSAEALFYTLARQESPNEPATSADGAKAVSSMIEELGYKPGQYRIADGSGLSVYDYVSPDLLLGFLIHAYRNEEIWDTFYDSFPIAGVDGTLRRRMKNTSAYNNVRGKTGTLTGVSSLAGYAQSADGHILAFVIINQNVLRGYQAHVFQDKFCAALCD